jgi:predicted transcriptional regulator
MTRIVHPHFPVEKLPDELRSAFGNATHVHLTVRDNEAEEQLKAEINAAVDRGLADIAAGRVHTAEEIEAWLTCEEEQADERLLAELDETLKRASDDIRAKRYFVADDVLRRCNMVPR